MMPHPRAEIDETALRDLWMDDVPAPEIARRLGCSDSAIYRRAEILDLPRRQLCDVQRVGRLRPSEKKPTKEPVAPRKVSTRAVQINEAAFRKAWLEGLSYEMMVARFRCCEGTITRRVVEYGLPKRGRGRNQPAVFHYDEPKAPQAAVVQHDPDLIDALRRARGTYVPVATVHRLAARYRQPVATVEALAGKLWGQAAR